MHPAKGTNLFELEKRIYWRFKDVLPRWTRDLTPNELDTLPAGINNLLSPTHRSSTLVLFFLHVVMANHKIKLLRKSFHICVISGMKNIGKSTLVKSMGITPLEKPGSQRINRTPMPTSYATEIRCGDNDGRGSHSASWIIIDLPGINDLDTVNIAKVALNLGDCAILVLAATSGNNKTDAELESVIKGFETPHTYAQYQLTLLNQADMLLEEDDDLQPQDIQAQLKDFVKVYKTDRGLAGDPGTPPWAYQFDNGVTSVGVVISALKPRGTQVEGTSNNYYSPEQIMQWMTTRM